MASRAALVKWLLDSDPAIRWQVMRDLTDEPDEVVAAERSRVASEGWGARLLGLQAPDGHWGDDRQHGWMPTNDAAHPLEGARRGSGGRDGPPGARPRARPHHLVAARRPALLRRRDRSLHQRADPRGGRLFRRRRSTGCSNACCVSSSRTAAGTARLRQASDPRSTPRSASWKGCSNTRRRGDRRPR